MVGYCICVGLTTEDQMAQQMLYIKDVTPHTRNWSVKVRVDEKQLPRQSQSSPRRYQRMIFVDEQGTKVVATIFEGDIELFRDCFEVHETYIVSKARVNPVDIKYQLFGNQFQWIINRTTAVRREKKDLIPRSVIMPVYIQFSEFPKYLGTKKLIDIIAVVVEKMPLRTIQMDKKVNTIREFAIIDPKMTPCMLTLWNELALNEGELIAASPEPMPVIAATRLIVSSYNNVSLSSTASSGIMLDPLIPEAQNLKSWRDNHKAHLTSVVKEKKYLNHDDSRVDLTLEPISLIADAVKTDDVQKFNVRVKARILDLAQKYYYMACPKCYSGTTAEYNWEFNCMRCQETHQAKPREKLSINIYDSSGDLDVMVFGNKVVQLLQINANALMEMEREAIPVNIETIHEKIKDEQFVMKIKKSIDYRHDGKHIRYSVLNLQEQKLSSNSQRLSVEPTSAQPLQNKERDSHRHTNLITCPPDESIILIKDAINSNDVSKFLIQVRVRIIDKTQAYFYMACPDCYTHTDAHYNLKFTCIHCGEINDAKPRERLFINVYDDSGDINLIAFGDDAAQIMQISAMALIDIEPQNIPPIMEALTERLKDEIFMMKIKKKFSKDGNKIHYSVISVHPINRQRSSEETSMHPSSSHVSQAKTQFQMTDGEEDASTSEFQSGESVVRRLFSPGEIIHDINAEDATDTSS